MEKTTHAPKFLRQRKLLIAIPILVLPFVSLAFWALGGGSTDASAQQATTGGFNSNLPGVQLKEGKPLDKMSYYNQAAVDSERLKEAQKNDPYYQVRPDAPQTDSQLIPVTPQMGYGGGSFGSGVNDAAYPNRAYTDPNEQKVYQKLNQLNAALATNTTEPAPNNLPVTRTAAVNTADVDRLEKMMQAMQQKDEADPEMAQLNSMLEKIMEVQNPGLVQERLRQTSLQRKGKVFAVTTSKPADPVSTLDKESGQARLEEAAMRLGGQQNGFYSFDNASVPADTQNAVEAVIHETQTVVNGATVKMRLTSDIYINGQLIPKGVFVYGMAILNGERLEIKIQGIRYNNNLYPVELSVFDIDGMNGIYIPGAISRDVAKESTDRGIQNIGLNTLDPSIGMQAAGVGVEAAKSLFSKKVKLIRVTVKAGYQVLLRDDKQKQD